MCGILGVKFSKKDNDTVEFVRNLIFNLKIRGLHSSGICFSKDNTNNFTLHKINQDEETETYNTNTLLESFLLSDSNSFIYHNRYSTSGDYKNNNNNQPIMIQGFGAIAVNGVLSQASKLDMEKQFNIKLESENDSEIFLRELYKSYYETSEGSITDILKKYPECSFAGVLLKDNQITGLRNNKRPLYIGAYNNCTFIVSTHNTIQRSTNNSFLIVRINPFVEVTL